MSYAEAQKLHDLKESGDGVLAGGQAEALRIVLAIVLDYGTAAWCLGWQGSGPVTRWPSTLYRILGRSALRSPCVWQRCALVLDRALHDAVAQYESRSPAELAELFFEGRDTLNGNELAALLWCLIRRRSAPHDLVAGRLSLELEVVAARRMRA
jgi:hypothetical protein